MSNNKYPTFIIEGGIGKHVMFTSLLPAIHKKYGRINLVNAYTDVFYDMEEYIVTNVGHADLYKKPLKDISSEYIFREPYKGNFELNKPHMHLLEAWAREYGLEYDGTLPQIRFNVKKSKYADKFEEFLNETLKNDFIIVQFTGGQPPASYNPESQYEINDMRKKRNYPLDLANYFVRKFQERYPNTKILDYSLPNEHDKLPGTIREKFPYIYYHEFAKHARAVVSIDSSLLHMATAARAPVIGLYGGIPYWEFGYSCNINLTNFDGPREEFDTYNPQYICVDPDRILKELENIMT